MPRPYPDRLRPGRRPPDRYKGGVAPHATRRGFTGPGLSAVYDMFLPLRVENRLYFNRAAAILALSAGYGGASWATAGSGRSAALGFLFGLSAGFLPGAAAVLPPVPAPRSALARRHRAGAVPAAPSGLRIGRAVVARGIVSREPVPSACRRLPWWGGRRPGRGPLAPRTHPGRAGVL